MRVLVCGGRDYTNGQKLHAYLDGKFGIDCIIQGGADGADALARGWAQRNGVALVSVHALWGHYGPYAGPRRNQDMINLLAPDLVIAAPGGKGTADMVARAEKAGISVERVE